MGMVPYFQHRARVEVIGAITVAVAGIIGAGIIIWAGGASEGWW